MMPFVDCCGDSRAVGRAHGEAMRAIIRERWETRLAPSMGKKVGGDEAMRRHIDEIRAATTLYLQSTFPDLLDEILGIGEGAGMTSEQAMVMQHVESLLTPQRIDISPPGSDGCTVIAFGDSPAGPFLFKTNDLGHCTSVDTPQKFSAKCEEENRLYVVIRAKYQDRQESIDTLGVRMAGSIWIETGVNDRGLAFGATSLHPRMYPQSARALPQHCLSTLMVKRCGNVAQARALLPRVPVYGKGAASAYVDTLGQCIGAEKTANFTGFNPPQLGIAFQTNHIRSEALHGQAVRLDPEFYQKAYYQNSAQRVRRIEHGIARWATMTDFESLVNDLYHAGACGDLIQNGTPVCHHWITPWSALCFPEKGELRVTDGPPLQKKFGTWRLT